MEEIQVGEVPVSAWEVEDSHLYTGDWEASLAASVKKTQETRPLSVEVVQLVVLLVRIIGSVLFLRVVYVCVSFGRIRAQKARQKNVVF